MREKGSNIPGYMHGCLMLTGYAYQRGHHIGCSPRWHTKTAKQKASNRYHGKPSTDHSPSIVLIHDKVACTREARDYS